jgi:phosphoribosylaminoimidazole-succinocarboxamide synthase
MMRVGVAAPLFRRGKVRDMYAVGDDRLLMVASDRVSAFDVVMAEPIPGKGAVLTAFSKFWFGFGKFASVVPNHFVSDDPSDLPAELRQVGEELSGRWLLVRRAERIDIECVVRGYLAGSAWAEYRNSGQVADEQLPAGMLEAQMLEQPIFTPAIKNESGHDENISRARLRAMVGSSLASELEERSLQLYSAGARHAEGRGLLLADTKFEFGTIDGQIILIDEVLTPDSSRYWAADEYQPGRAQPSFDKQFLRDFLQGSGWNKEPPPPPLPDWVVEGTAQRYAEALRRLT